MAYEGLPYPQGDPGAADSASARLSALVIQLGQTATAVGTGAPASWQGHAAAVYGETVRAVGSSLSGALGALSGAATAVRQAGQVLEDAQQEVERLARRVRRAREEAERADREATTAEREAQAADARAQQAASATTTLVSGAGSPFGPLPGTAERMEALKVNEHAARLRARAVRMREEYLDEKRRATQQAREATDDVKRADRSTAAMVSAAGGAAPAAFVPAVVRRYAPVLYFHPDQKYLPADATADWLRYRAVMEDAVPGGVTGYDLVRKPGLDLPDSEAFRRGQGPGAPIYTKYDTKNGIIHYLFWYRYNQMRNKRRIPFGTHPGDWEGISVKLGPDGKAEKVLYRVHTGDKWHDVPAANALDDRGRIRGYPALGSQATYSRPGAFTVPVGPWDDLAARDRKDPAHTVDARRNLRPADGQPWAADRTRAWGDPFGGSPSGPLGRRLPGPEHEGWDRPAPVPRDVELRQAAEARRLRFEEYRRQRPYGYPPRSSAP